MTRDEFVALYGDFDIGDSETGEQAGASAQFTRDLDALLAAARAEALHLAMAECEAEAALCDSEKSGLDAGSAARNCRDRIEFALVKP